MIVTYIYYVTENIFWYTVLVPGGYFHKQETTIPPYTWLHSAMAYRGPNNDERIKIYQDGVDKGSETTRISYTTVTLSATIKIGRQYDEPGGLCFESAHVDELLFWNQQMNHTEVNMIISMA